MLQLRGVLGKPREMSKAATARGEKRAAAELTKWKDLMAQVAEGGSGVGK